MKRAELISLIALCFFLAAGSATAQGFEPEAAAVPLVATNQDAAPLPYSPSPLDFTWDPKITPLTSNWLWWKTPLLSFTLDPLYAPLSTMTPSSGSPYTLSAYGAEVGAEYRFPYFPMLVGGASVGYSLMTSSLASSSLSYADAAVLAGLRIDVFFLSLRLLGMLGVSTLFANDSSGGSSGTFVGGRLALSFAFTSWLGIALGFDIKSIGGGGYAGVTSYPAASLGLEYTIVPPEPADLDRNGLQIKDLKLKDVEADKYASYATSALGTIVVQNTLGSSAKDVKVSLIVPKYMKAPGESKPVKEVKSGQETSVDLFALFDESMAEASGVTSVPAQITVTGILDGKPISVTGMGTLRILGGGASLVVHAPPTPAGAIAAPGAQAPGSASGGSGGGNPAGKGSNGSGQVEKNVPGAASQLEPGGTSAARTTNAAPTAGRETTGTSGGDGRAEAAGSGNDAGTVQPSVRTETADRSEAAGGSGSTGSPGGGGLANLALPSLPPLQQTDGTEWAVEGIAASDGDATDHFGYSVVVSSDGNTIGIGAPGHADNQGKAYVYTRNSSEWSEVRISAKDGAPSDGFGASVAIAGNGEIMAVGARGKNNNQGAVYVYRLVAGNWQGAEIIASDGTPSDAFGTSVALSTDGSTLAVGAIGSADKHGKVYVYKGSGPARTKVMLVASDGSSGDGFGSSMALSADGSTLAVGAKGKGKNAGKVYVFEWNGGWEETGITPPDSTVDGYFGSAVALSADGTEMAVGSNGAERNRGKVYLYTHLAGGWVEHKVAAYDGAANDSFGTSVALSADGGVLAIGAYGRSDGQGKAYVYRLSADAVSESPIAETDGAAKDHFGFSLSLSSDGSEVVVGSEQKAVGSTAQQGKVDVGRLIPGNGS
jgi:hypothetical protein